MCEVKTQAYPSDFGFSSKDSKRLCVCAFVPVCAYSEHLVIIFRELQMTQRWEALRLIDWRHSHTPGHTPISSLTATVNPLKMGSNVIERHSGSTHQHTMSRATNGPALIWSTCFSCHRHTLLQGTTSEQQGFALGFFSGVCVFVSVYSVIMSVYYSLGGCVSIPNLSLWHLVATSYSVNGTLLSS